MERSNLLIPAKVYLSLNHILQIVKDSQGSGDIIIVNCESFELLQEFTKLLGDHKIQMIISRPTSWEDMHNILFESNANVVIWLLDIDTPDEVYTAIDFNRDAFFETKRPSVFWVTSTALKKLIEKSPNFWRYRSVIEKLPLMPRRPDEIARYIDLTYTLKDEWEKQEEIKSEIESLKNLIGTTKNPIRRARFLAQLGKLQLSMYVLSHERSLINESLENLRNAIEIMKSERVKDHIYVESLVHYVEALIKVAKYDEAINYALKALNVVNELPLDDTLKVLEAKALNKLGYAYMLTGKYDSAIEKLEKALEIMLKILGEEHPDVATIYRNLGKAYYSMGDYDKAIDHYKKALKTQLKVLGEEHPDTAATYHDLGSAYYSKGDIYTALEYYGKALKIWL